jgi:WD40 repeat protein
VYSINPTSTGEFLSVGKDDVIARWPANFSAVKESIPIPKGSKVVGRAVTEFNKSILVGTNNSQIYEIGADKKAKVLVQGHADGELWGLATHPSKPQYATAGDDSAVKVWDASTRTSVSSGKLGSAARSVDYSPDGKFLAVGLANGGVIGMYCKIDCFSSSSLCLMLHHSPRLPRSETEKRPSTKSNTLLMENIWQLVLMTILWTFIPPQTTN